MSLKMTASETPASNGLKDPKLAGQFPKNAQQGDSKFHSALPGHSFPLVEVGEPKQNHIGSCNSLIKS